MNDDPRLDPAEEEALRRVRISLMRAVRSEGAPSRRRPDRRAVLAICGLLLAVAAGGAALVASRDDNSRSVDVIGEDPPPSSTSVVPTTTSEAPPPTASTSTTVPLGPMPLAQPEEIVAVTEDGRLVVVDAWTARELRELARGGDPTIEYEGEGPPPNVIANVSVDRANGLVYYESCCEPAAGALFSVPLAGGESIRVLDAGWPATSGDGRLVAGLVGTSGVVVRDTATGQQRWAFDTIATDMVVIGLAISGDGAMLALERPDGVLVLPTAALVDQSSSDPSDAPFEQAVLLKDPDGIGYMHPAFRRDGMLVVAQQCCYGPDEPTSPTQQARVLDPSTGAIVASFDYEQPVLDQEYDSSRTWLLVTYANGRVAWFGTAAGSVAGTFRAAAW